MTGESLGHVNDVMAMVLCCDGPTNSSWRRRTIARKEAQSVIRMPATEYAKLTTPDSESEGRYKGEKNTTQSHLQVCGIVCYFQGDRSPPPGGVGRTIAT